MRLPSKVQISDLKSTESFVAGELTLEEAEKIVGGSGLDHDLISRYIYKVIPLLVIPLLYVGVNVVVAHSTISPDDHKKPTFPSTSG